ncbi:Laminin subunit alpha-2 [Schistosoma japonicum]|nr:Laminin subunit alpha-2 [Schistosoma japonicum]
MFTLNSIGPNRPPLGQRPHSIEMTGSLNVDESYIDPFLELAPFSARSEKMYGEGHSKAEHGHIIRNLPMSLESLKAHLPFLATHLQETLAESGFTENSDQCNFGHSFESTYPKLSADLHSIAHCEQHSPSTPTPIISSIPVHHIPQQRSQQHQQQQTCGTESMANAFSPSCELRHDENELQHHICQENIEYLQKQLSDMKHQLHYCQEREKTKEQLLEESYNTTRQLQESVTNLFQQVGERENLLHKLSLEVNKLKNKHEEVISQRDAFQNQTKELEERCHDLHKQYKNNTSNLKAMVKERDELLAKMKSELENTEHISDERKRQIMKMLKDTSNIREKLDLQIGRSMQLEAELTRLKSANTQLENGIQEMTRQSLSNAQTSAAEIRALQEEKLSAYNEHQLEINQIKKELNQLSNENTEYKKEISRLQNKITELKDEFTQCKNNFQIKTNILEEKEKQIQSLTHELESCRRELETQINSFGLFKSEQKIIQNSLEEKIKQMEIIDNQRKREAENLSMDLNQAKEQIMHSRKSLELLQSELSSSRTMLIKSREEIVKRSHNEEQLEKSLQKLKAELGQTIVHKNAAEIANKTAITNIQEMEIQLESYKTSNITIQTHLQELGKELDETKSIKSQLEERVSTLTEHLQIAQKQVEEKQAQLNHSESIVNRMSKEFKRTQMTIEESAQKVNCLLGQLKTTQEKLDRTNEHLNEIESSRKNLLKESEEYRSSHHAHDSEVQSMEVQINYLLSELGQMNDRITTKQKEITDSQSERQINESALEIQRLNSILNEKQMKLDQLERQVIEMDSQLKSSDQYTQSLSLANDDLINELKSRTNEIEKLQNEIKQNMTGMQNSEFMIQELEFSVQQLTKQLEQSEHLRVEAEKASTLAVSESAAVKVELAKKDEQIISLQNTANTITQKLKSLEQTSSQTEQIINRYINSEIEKDNIIQRLQTEMEHMRYQLVENETELQNRSSQIKSLTHDLEVIKTDLSECTLHRNSENLARKRLELEVTELREMRLAFTEQMEKQEQFIERLQSELANERERNDFLSKIKTEKERELHSITNEIDHLHHHNKELSGRLLERDSALDSMSRELELFTSRLDTTSKSLTETEAELLEMKHKYELSEVRANKQKEELKQYEITLSSLETRLVESESQLAKCTGQYNQHDPVDRIQCSQLTEIVKDLKQQITEYKKTNTVLRTERAHLQETVNRLEGELAARSDALRKAAVDATHMKTKHETELKDRTSQLNESLYQMENKWKEACKMIDKLEKEYKDQEFKLAEVSTNSNDENKLLRQKLDSLESRNRMLCNELETIKLSRENLQNEYNHMQDELDKLKKKNECTGTRISASIQAVQKSVNASTNTENIEQSEAEYLPKLRLSRFRLQPCKPCITRSKSYSERNKIRQLSPYESAKSINYYTNSSDNSPDSIESRVEALKQANQYLRMEVENACKMLNSSILNKSKLEEEFLSMPKVKYSKSAQFDIGNNKHKVEFFDEPDECIEYGNESLVGQESKTVWLERSESISQKFHDNSNYWSNKAENTDKMKSVSQDTVQNSERQTNSLKITSISTDRKVKPTRLLDSNTSTKCNNGSTKLIRSESNDYHVKPSDKFARITNMSKIDSIPIRHILSCRSSKIK